MLPAGHRPPNPSELLGSKEMTELLALLESQFDYLIVDAPPILAVTDAALIAKDVGGALMVVASGTSRKEGLREALGMMNSADARVLGIVLTMVPSKGPYGYSYYRYDYSSQTADTSVA